MKTLLIKQVTQDLTKPITKGQTMRGLGFIMPVIYHVEDGTIIQSYLTSERKKGLPERLEREQRAASASCLEAQYGEDGSFWGTISKWQMTRAGSLEPQQILTT